LNTALLSNFDVLRLSKIALPSTLDIDYWLLIIGYWLLIIGYWLLIIGY